MKNYTVFAILTLIISFFLLTGFQCASQEMTSAKLYFARQDWQSAEKWLVKEVEKNPTNHEAWWLLGQTRVQLYNFRGAVEAYNASLKNNNEFADKIHQAKKYVWSQTINRGVIEYNQSTKASPDSAKMLLGRAIESYKLATEINPDTIITYQYLAAAYQAQGNTDEEIKTYNEVLKHKEDIGIRTSLANAYLKRAQAADANNDKQTATDNYNNALISVLEARKITPDDVELLSTMINIYVRLDRAEEAKPSIREGIQKDPNNKVYQYNLGVLLMKTDSLDEAITHFESTLKIDPKFEVALQNIGVAYLRVGDKMKQAAQTTDLKKVIDQSYLKKFTKATEYLEQLTELSPDNADSWELLGTAYANANMVEKANKALEKADALRKK